MTDSVAGADERQLRWMLRAALVALAAGVLAFLVKGADLPADPYIDGDATTTEARDELAPGGDAGPAPEGFGEIAVTVTAADGAETLWCLLAAITQEQRARGLMEVESLGDYPGMAFVYDEDVQHSFYMRNTPMPLTIAWVSADGRVVDTADMAPCGDREDCPTYGADEPYRYAIEVPQGGLPGLGISEDAEVAVGGACKGG